MFELEGGKLGTEGLPLVEVPYVFGCDSILRINSLTINASFFKLLFIKITLSHYIKRQSTAKIRVMIINLFRTLFMLHVDHNTKLIFPKLGALP